MEPFCQRVQYAARLNHISYSPDTTFTLQSLSRPSVNYNASLFRQHELQPKAHREYVQQPYPSDWIVLSFLVCLILIAWGQVFYHKRLKQIYYAPLSQRFLNILTKEGSLFKERLSVALSFIYVFAFSLFISLLVKEFLPERFIGFHDYQVFALCTASVISFWLIKISLIRFLGNVFHTYFATKDYLQNILAFSFITGLILLPLLLMTVFLHSTIMLYISLIFIFLLYFFRVMRGVFIGISLKKFSWLFLFVYLCSLEILPLVVIFKVFYLISKGS